MGEGMRLNIEREATKVTVMVPGLWITNQLTGLRNEKP
jgi:hypothetical protein